MKRLWILFLLASWLPSGPTFAAQSHGITIAMPEGWQENAKLTIPNAAFQAFDPRPDRALQPFMMVEFLPHPLGNLPPLSGYEALIRAAGGTDIVSRLSFILHRGVTVRRMEITVTLEGERRRSYIYLLPRGGITASVVFVCADAEGDALLPLFDATIRRFEGVQHPTAPTRVMDAGDAIAFRLGPLIAWVVCAMLALWCAVKLRRWMGW